MQSIIYKPLLLNHLNHFMANIKIHKGQLWLTKTRYTDALGNDIKSSHPIIVLLTTSPFEYFDTEFVRAYYISPSVEMSSGDPKQDVVVSDVLLLDFH